MGRLEQAMRRAAAEKAETEVRPSAAASGASSVAVEADVFPSENGEQFDLPASTGAAAPPAGGVAVAPVPSDRSQPAASGPLATSPATEVEVAARLHATLQTKTVVDEHMAPEAREQYRRLAAALHQAQRTNGFKVVMIVSAVAGEGKSLTAANLALTLSGSYRKTVLLMDADLRRPSQHQVFQVPGAPGLTEGLLSGDDHHLPLHKITDRLTLLPAGRPTSDPIGGLTSERMRRLVNEAREVFDWVIVDTPPVGLMSDAALLTSTADAVVLVVKAGATPYDRVQRAVEAIGRERVLGTVLNRAEEQPHQSGYEYYRYYGQPKTPAKV